MYSNSAYNPSTGPQSSSGYNPGAGGYNSGGFGSSSNANRDYEFNQFRRNPEYMEVVKNVLRRLGFVNFMPNETIVEDIYNMCRYEKAW